MSNPVPMPVVTHPSAAFLSSVGGLLSAAPFGVSFQLIGLGCLFYIIGLFGRICFEWQKAAETNDKVKINNLIGWFGAGVLGSPFVTILILVLLKVGGFQTDAVTAIILLGMGFMGSKGFTQLMDVVGVIFKNTIGKLANGTSNQAKGD